MREELARQRERELRRWAERRAQLGSSRKRPEPARKRVSRTIARIGLALARGFGDA